MYAIRSHRVAAGITIDGAFYPHTQWTLVNDLTDAIKAAAEPKTGQSIPDILIIEVSGKNDAALKPFGLVSAKDAKSNEKATTATIPTDRPPDVQPDAVPIDNSATDFKPTDEKAGS